MRLVVINILILYSTQVWAQTDLGVGLVSIIDFDEKTILEFYSDTIDKSPRKEIMFFYDKTVSRWDIEGYKKKKKWLNPEVLWLPRLTFRCRTKTEKWLEVIVNNDNQKTYWIKRDNSTKFEDWEEYLQNTIGIERLSNRPQKIRTHPIESSKEIKYQGSDCFSIKSVKGNWIEITTPPYCLESFPEYRTPIESGWIKWRNGNELIINCFAVGS